MKILHLTDIHLNSEYESSFPAMGHLERILRDTSGMGSQVDAVVVTGDLVDEGKFVDYLDLFNLLAITYGVDTPILVTPGNHDNRKAFAGAYDEFRQGKSWRNSENISIYGSFENPGEAVTILNTFKTTPDGGTTYQARSAVLMDTGHRAFPYQGLCRMMSCFGADSRKWPQYILFTHMPIIRPFHKFMNKPGFTIEDDDEVFLAGLEQSGCQAIVCGHYHCESHMVARGIRQYAGPANQVQIDPFSDNCNPSGNYPGYGILTDDLLIEYHTNYIVGEDAAEKAK